MPRRSSRARRCSASPAPAAPASRSLTDELIRRLRLDQDDALRIAVITIDPSRRKSGGALLGDRIRMNAIGPWRGASADDAGERVFMRSLATRDFGSEISQALPDVLAAVQGAPASTWSSSRPPASARATRRSCRWSTCRCT